MWRDVFLNNRPAVLELLGRFTEDLVNLQRAIRYGEADVLEDWFTKTRNTRRNIVDQGQFFKSFSAEGEDRQNS
jgi:cyclohexadieny/prephenate dehydrogenase